MHAKRNEPHPVGDFVAVCSLIGLNDQAFVEKVPTSNPNRRILTGLNLLGFLAFMDNSGNFTGF